MVPGQGRGQGADMTPVVVVMGVTGTGKTTLARQLATDLDWPFQEGDQLHSAGNIAKLAAGVALTDEDRAPWLAAIGRWIDARNAQGGGGTVSCSALRRSYRDTLRAGRPNVRFVLLTGTHDQISARLAHRTGHFMSPSLLTSQLNALEPPGVDEPVLSLPIMLELAEKSARVQRWLHETHPAVAALGQT